MSLIVTVHVREGIVMAADSRLTLSAEKRQTGQSARVNLAVGQSDSNYKLFLTPGGVGISTCGDAAVEGVPIAGYVESFIESDLTDQGLSAEEVAARLAEHFGSFEAPPKTQFHVAGYTKTDGEPHQEVWLVTVVDKQVKKLNANEQQGASWAGEGDILARLLQPVAVIGREGEVKQRFPVHPIPYGFFTLQDAIDFTVFAMRSTIDAIRFQPRAKTVGGPIDVLVIKPSGAEWIQRKELRIER